MMIDISSVRIPLGCRAIKFSKRKRKLPCPEPPFLLEDFVRNV
jgi:hypothetical protein